VIIKPNTFYLARYKSYAGTGALTVIETCLDREWCYCIFRDYSVTVADNFEIIGELDLQAMELAVTAEQAGRDIAEAEDDEADGSSIEA
jgi:hypothetical protein